MLNYKNPWNLNVSKNSPVINMIMDKISVIKHNLFQNFNSSIYLKRKI
jgi:hypothetical protein